MMQLKIHILPIKKLTEQLKELKKKPAGTIGIIVCSDENNYLEELLTDDASLPVCILSFQDTERREHPSAVKENHAEALKEYLRILFSANKVLSETNILPDNDNMKWYVRLLVLFLRQKIWKGKGSRAEQHSKRQKKCMEIPTGSDGRKSL